MSTPPNSRRSARGSCPPTSMSDSSHSSGASRSGTSVEPKNEYLRSALEARRAKQAPPATSSAEPKPQQPRTSSSVAPVDPWLDQAESEEDAVQMPPARRSRRPSEGIQPRMRTQRETQTENENLKTQMFNLKMKLELVSKQNSDLKDERDAAEQRIKELEPLEDENIDLREENDMMKLKMQDMDEEIGQLRDENNEILQVQAEAVANMEQQDSALDEAAEIIFQMENEKLVLKEENSRLLNQVTALQSAATAEQYSEGSDRSARDRYPTRVYSVDESRPSTSHFDSDYYSQPASPQVRAKASKDSVTSVAYSERAKNFLQTNREGKLAVQDLKKRLSDASMKSVRPKSSLPPPVPPIPEVLPEPQTMRRTPKKYRPAAPPMPALNTARASPIRTHTAPQTPTGQSEGLRGMYRDTPTTLDGSSRDSRPSSSNTKSPLAHRSSRTTHSSDVESPYSLPTQAPPRQSSRKAHTSKSHEQLSAFTRGDAHAEEDGSEWGGMAPSTVMTDDLPVNEPDRHQWWKNIDRHYQGANPSLPTGSRDRRPQQYQQKDMLFNPLENEDEFMERNGPRPRKR